MSQIPVAVVSALFAVLSLSAQDAKPIPSVRGELQTDDAAVEPHLVVQLQGLGGHLFTQQAYATSDGSFEFRDVPSGSYVVKVLRLPEEVILEQYVNIMGVNDRLELRLPKHATASRPGSATVSVRQLRHPPSKNALRAFAKAQHYSEAGDHSKAIAELQRTLDDSSAEGYAHANLGVEYLRLGQTAAAIVELESAARLLPDSPAVHTNFAYALSRTGQLDQAEQEARLALQADRGNAKAQYMLGHILLTKGVNADEGIANLKLASGEVPSARLVLAQFYARHGQSETAARELREFLKQAGGEDRTRAEHWLAALESPRENDRAAK